MRQCVAHFLAVVEVVAHAVGFLVCLMSFSGHKHHFAFRGGEYGRAYGFAAVGDDEGAAQLAFAQAGLHVGDDGGRVFGARVVGG